MKRMMLLTSGKCLRLSIVILLTPRDGLFSAHSMGSRLAMYPCSSCKLVWNKSCISQMIKWLHACDSGMIGLVNGSKKGWYSELCKGRAQNATICKFRSCSTVEVGKMYYSVGWLLKIVSTSWLIVLEADKLWLLYLQKLSVCAAMKVVLSSLLTTKKTRKRKQQSTLNAH